MNTTSLKQNANIVISHFTLIDKSYEHYVQFDNYY